MINLEEIEARHTASTGGVWLPGRSGSVVAPTPNPTNPPTIGGAWDPSGYGGHLIAETITAANAEFVAAAHQDIPLLIAELRRLRNLAKGNQS